MYIYLFICVSGSRPNDFDVYRIDVLESSLGPPGKLGKIRAMVLTTGLPYAVPSFPK